MWHCVSMSRVHLYMYAFYSINKYIVIIMLKLRYAIIFYFKAVGDIYWKTQQYPMNFITRL